MEKGSRTPMMKHWIENNFNRIIEIRRWLHKHPEVGFDEHESSRYCQKLMKDRGYKIIQNEKNSTFVTNFKTSGVIQKNVGH